MELALAGRIDRDVDRAWVVDPAPTGDPSLDPVLGAHELLSKFSSMDLIGQNVRRYLYLFERDMAR